MILGIYKSVFSIFFLWSVCHIIQNLCFCDSLIRIILLIQMRPWDWSKISPSSNCAFSQSRILYSHHSSTAWSDIILSKPLRNISYHSKSCFLIYPWPSSIVLKHTCFWLFSVIQEHLHAVTFLSTLYVSSVYQFVDSLSIHTVFDYLHSRYGIVVFHISTLYVFADCMHFHFYLLKKFYFLSVYFSRFYVS